MATNVSINTSIKIHSMLLLLIIISNSIFKICLKCDL